MFFVSSGILFSAHPPLPHESVTSPCFYLPSSFSEDFDVHTWHPAHPPCPQFHYSSLSSWLKPPHIPLCFLCKETTLFHLALAACASIPGWRWPPSLPPELSTAALVFSLQSCIFLWKLVLCFFLIIFIINWVLILPSSLNWEYSLCLMSLKPKSNCIALPSIPR